VFHVSSPFQLWVDLPSFNHVSNTAFGGGDAIVEGEKFGKDRFDFLEHFLEHCPTDAAKRVRRNPIAMF
jgi:hypothetical protein